MNERFQGCPPPACSAGVLGISECLQLGSDPQKSRHLTYVKASGRNQRPSSFFIYRLVVARKLAAVWAGRLRGE